MDVPSALRIDWGQVAGFFEVTGVMATIVWGVTRLLLGKSFVSRTDFHALDGRVTVTEVAMRNVATKDEVRALEGQFADLRVDIAKFAVKLQSTCEGVNRIDANLGRLTDHLLEREQPK